MRLLSAPFRALARHKLPSALNLAGLSLGMAVFLTMALIVRYEYSYDSATPNAAQIYQLDMEVKQPGQAPAENQSISFVPFPFLKQDFTGIDAAIRVLISRMPVRVGDTLATEEITMTDAAFFDVFDLKILDGSRDHALDGPGKVVLSASMARKYFGTIYATGRQIRIDNSAALATVTAVIADQPPNSSTTFDIVEPFTTATFSKLPFRNWGSEWGKIWLRIHDPATASRINTGLIGYPMRHPGDYTLEDMRQWFGTGGLGLLPLRSVHFRAAEDDVYGASSKHLIDILGLVGLAALATAIINYINLSTARATLRAREVAMRKVLGATRTRLIAQFMAEALVLTFLSGAIAVSLTELAIRPVNELGGWSVSDDFGFVLPMAAIIAFLTGLAAGAYPALILSSYRPAPILASSKTPGLGRMGAALRNGLVVVQFSFATLLAICTLVMVQQTQFLSGMDRGLRQDGLIVVNALNDDSLRERQAEIVQRLARLPGITSASRGDLYPFHMYDNSEWQQPGNHPTTDVFWGLVAPDYFQTIGAHLLSGRLLDADHGTDFHENSWRAPADTSIIITRLAARDFGFATPDSAIGQQIVQKGNTTPYRIVGVIEDIRMGDDREPMHPLIFLGQTGPTNYVGALVHFSGMTDRAAMAELHTAWQQLAPDVPFSAWTASTIFALEYRSDADHGTLFGAGSGIALLIACLGLYGLATFNISRRLHEIGIRKVLGARSRDILLLLTTQFLRPVALANLIAWPIAWIAMSRWLSSFDQRIALTPLPFLGISLAACAIALATIVVQAMRAARQAPAVALRAQ